jgi:3-hydroxyanthranilate 3,4-dioxygenase
MTKANQTTHRVVALGELTREGAATFPGALAARSLYPDSQFDVVLVRGPNRRNDFHVDPYDELFMQLEGTICVVTREDGVGPRRQYVRAGELFLVPAGMPHCPQRPTGTWGVVVEIRRKPGDTEAAEWYCDQCGALIERVTVQSPEMIESLGPLLDQFQASEARRTCRSCGALLAPAAEFVLGETQ